MLQAKHQKYNRTYDAVKAWLIPSKDGKSYMKSRHTTICRQLHGSFVCLLSLLPATAVMSKCPTTAATVGNNIAIAIELGNGTVLGALLHYKFLLGVNCIGRVDGSIVRLNLA